jgi:uncharacterized membrane protein YdjX (TVP38/TMEM64 family)
MADSTAAHAFHALPELLAHWSAWTESAETLWAVATSQDRLSQWVEGFGLLAPLAYFLAEAAQVIFSPLPGALLPPVGALAFGPWAALALSLAGCAVGAAVVFALARRCGRPLVRRLLKPHTLERYTGVLADRGGFWLFLVFAIPILPGDATCALAGLSSIPFQRFIVFSTLGRAPSTALAILLAAELSTAPAWAVPIAALALAAGFTVTLAHRSRIEAWLLRPAAAVAPPHIDRHTRPTGA